MQIALNGNSTMPYPLLLDVRIAHETDHDGLLVPAIPAVRIADRCLGGPRQPQAADDRHGHRESGAHRLDPAAGERRSTERRVDLRGHVSEHHIVDLL